MASAIVFLMYACALLPPLAAQKDSKPCVFPFKYKKNLYYSCTTIGTADWKLWCATTKNYDKDQQWKWCATQEYGGNSHGRPCVFPFFYKKKTYYTCATEHFDKPWCATTGSFDNNKKWSYCADTRLSAEPSGHCVFPFIFQGQPRLTCVTDGSSNGEPFCSLTDHYDADLKKVPCAATHPGNCTFPFMYKENMYCSCTRDGTSGGPLWCGTTSDYDIDSEWKPCDPQDPAEQDIVIESECAFPFKYRGKKFYTCTTAGSFFGKLWCSLTRNYDVDGKWKYCVFSCPTRCVEVNGAEGYGCPLDRCQKSTRLGAECEG